MTTKAVGIEDTNAPVRTFTMLGSADDLQVNGRLYSAEHVIRVLDTHDELVKALETAIRIAREARIEWDRAPNGMKAGKLLIALHDPDLRYRDDITEMHAALARSKAQGGA